MYAENDWLKKGNFKYIIHNPILISFLEKVLGGSYIPSGAHVFIWFSPSQSLSVFKNHQ